MKRTTLLLLIALLSFCWSGLLGEPLPVTAQTGHRLQCVVVKGQFLGRNGKPVHEYDYLEPGLKYRLLPKAKVQLSTLDGKKIYEAVGPGVVFLNTSGSVLFNGNALKPKAQQSLLQNVTASKVSSHELAGLPFRGIKVVARTEDGGTRLLPLYSGYHALVVGVSNYDKWPKLPNPVNDAKQVAEKLKKLGFRVKLVLNPTSSELTKALNDLTYGYGRDKNQALLFFYAGHGETEVLADGTKLGYIIPRDCPLLRNDPHGFVNKAISMKDIEAYSLRIRSKHVLMLFDSCFSGALFALVRAVPHDITEKSTMPVRQYITAGREDEEVPDRSMFKRCLLIGLDGDADLTGDGYITGSELGMYLADKVVNYTHRGQHPQYGKINNPDLDRGDFIFVPLKQRLKEAEQEKERQKQELALARQVGRMQEQIKVLLEKKRVTEKRTKSSLTEKKDLEEKLQREADERTRKEALAEAKIKELEARYKASLEKLEKEAAAKTVLAAELKRQRLIEKELKQAEEKRKKDEQLAEERIRNLEAERMASEKQLQKEAANKQVLEGELRKKEAIEEELKRVKMQQSADKELAERRARELEAERLTAEEKVRKEAAGKKALEEELRRKRDIEQQLKKAEQEEKANKELMVAKIIKLDKKRKIAEDKALKEATAQKALEDELNRVKSKVRETTQSIQGLKRKQPEKTRLAYIPKKAIPDVLSPDSIDSKLKEIARDGRFIAYSNGTVLDTKTNLMWAAKDDGKGFMEHDVKDYIANYRGGGHTDWRLPTMEELEMICDRDMTNEHGYHVTKLIDIAGSWVWGYQGWGNMWAFDFSISSPAIRGHSSYALNPSYWSQSCRALPVRNAKHMKPRAAASSKIRRVEISSDVSSNISTADVGSQKKVTGATPRKTVVASLTPGPVVSKDGEIARDGRFIAYANGTVLDTKTNLIWAAKDDGKGLIESDAKDYIENYQIGGYKDWRMPTMGELETIYDRDMENEHGYHVTKLIDIAGERVWGSEGWGNMWAFDFSRGSPAVSYSHGGIRFNFPISNALALPVRDAKHIKPRATASSSIRYTETAKDDFNKTSSSDMGSQNKGNSTTPRKTVVASLTPGPVVSKGGEIARDGRFTAYANGTVLDTKTNLMWAGSDAGVESLYHSDATSYCEGYRGGGHTDWRMPTLDELETLYNEKLSNQHGYHITKLIDVGTDYIWADHSSWGGPAVFNFKLGSPAVGGHYDAGKGNVHFYSARALPVRTGN